MGASPRTPGREKLGGTAEHGYLHCGPPGAGHFVKMVHNGIEYGLMAAYAEGLNILQHANVGKRRTRCDAETTPLRNPEHYQYDLNLADVAEVWRRGSVIASWLLDLHGAGALPGPAAGEVRRPVSDSGEGRWTIMAAIDEGVPAYRAERGAVRALHLARRGRVRRTRCCPRCASSSAATSRRSSRMEKTRSDALVFFGATGDLAYKKIFPALQALVRRGNSISWSSVWPDRGGRWISSWSAPVRQ